MIDPLKVLTVGEQLPALPALEEAARTAGVKLEIEENFPADETALREVALIVVDEARTRGVRERFERAGIWTPLLVLCDGPLSDASIDLIRQRATDVVQRGDLVAIASALRRAADNAPIQRGEESTDLMRAQLEELVRQRTRELEELHQRQRVSERMVAMGTLSTGIGHDVGNLVLPLRIGLESLESRKLPAACEPDLQAIRKAVEYLQALANGLRYLAMDPEDSGLGARHSDLTEWWSDVEPLLNNCLPREVTLVGELSDDLPYVSVPLHHLTQAVFNLVQNAGDAMRRQGAGTVRIRAETIEPSNDEQAGELMVRLQVIDDGPGMAPDVRERCLEPFFTTKFRGVRTGLGLPLVHGVMHRIGGEVQLDSEPGRGTTWSLLLPAKRRSDRHMPGQRPVARVELGDNRMRAYVTSVLQSLDFDVDGQDEHSPATLCVIESESPLMKTADSLLNEDERLHIVLFGESPDGAHPRFVKIGANPPSAKIRSTLRDIRAGL